MIFCNGFPKSGTHALQKAMELLGQPTGEVAHVAWKDAPTDFTHRIQIIRDPRNIIVSWLRFTRDSVTPGKFISRFRQFQNKSLAEEMAGYLPDATVHVVRYEDLIASPVAMQAIAAHLGIPYLAGAWEELPGMTITWNDIKSDYRAVWTEEVARVWQEEGGEELLAAWGYA